MKRVDQIIAEDARRAMREDQALRRAMSAVIPSGNLEELLFSRLESEVLHLSVRNAVWLTQLRFFERPLLAKLQGEGFAVRSVKCHVLPARGPVKARRVLRAEPMRSVRGAQGIRQLAESTDDERLRNSLLTMAEHLSRR